MSRILFVDDEPMVLQALQNAMRTKRKDWEMAFKGSGAAGLVELERAPVDVIVTDMRMREMDGADFLSRAGKLCPGATRIILSGHMVESSLARAAITAHRFLNKPCTNELLCSSISRSLELRALLQNEHVRARIGGIDSLPAVPSVYRALSEALSSERASPEQIAKIVEQDVGIGAKILQLVNSSFFGLPRKTTSLLQAVRYLGTNTIRSLVLSHSVFAQLGHQNPALAEHGQEHALRCARIARRLLNGGPEADLAFTTGLLHDVGSLVLASRMPAEYADICAHAAATGVPIHDVETERLGVSHAQVGAYLLGLWGLPHEVLELVLFHHTPWSASLPLDAASALKLAEAISLEVTQNRRGASAHAQPLPDGWLEQPGVSVALAEARTQAT